MGNGNEILIAAHGLSVRHGARPVLQAIDLEVRRGEIVTLIGPNGAGKTTLVRALLGLVRLEAGRIETAPGLVIGYVPQRLSLDPTLPLTARRFLTLSQRSDAASVDTVLAEVGASALARRQMAELSGGEFQRVLLARALLRRPDLLVLDEPTQGVDFTGQIELFRLIGALRDARGCGVLVVSHDLHLVMSATDRVLCINHHLCCSGAPAAVSRDPEYLRLFGPRAAESLAVYAHHHDHVHAPDGRVLPLGAGDGPGEPHAHHDHA